MPRGPRAKRGVIGLVDDHPGFVHIRILCPQALSSAQELLATALAQQLLLRQFLAATPAEPNGRSALFACVEASRHSLGLRMVARMPSRS